MVGLRASTDGLLVGVRVTPSAKRTRIGGVYGDRLKVFVSAPPENDRANQELVRMMAEWLGVPRDYVSLHSGNTSKDKIVAVRGLEERVLGERLEALANRARVERGNGGR